jgi:hypothetical protein
MSKNAVAVARAKYFAPLNIFPITSFLFHSEAKSLFEEKDYRNAIQKYTEAIGADSTDDVTFFSNRRFVVLSLIAINEISLVLAMAH